MLPDRVSNPGPPTYESGALPIALRGPARMTLDLYGFVYTDRANFLFDGVGVGSAEQGH